MASIQKPNAEQIGWKVEQSHILFHSQWFQLRQDVVILPQDQITYTYVDHPGSVFIVPVTDDRHIILIHSYRYTIDEWCWEIPAGTLGDQNGKTPEQAALRELEEEIGAQCRTVTHLGHFYLSNGIAKIPSYFFLAEGVVMNRTQQLEPSEMINRIERVSFQQANAMITEGRLNDADSAFAILLALQRMERLNS